MANSQVRPVTLYAFARQLVSSKRGLGQFRQAKANIFFEGIRKQSTQGFDDVL